MLFTSPTFLFFYLPATFLLYFISKRKYKNGVLCLASLVFYGLGAGPSAAFILMLSVIVNFTGAILITTSRANIQKLNLCLLILINILPLIIFKYLGFFVEIYNELSGLFGVLPLTASFTIELPIGISFFTFQAVSYVVDVYAKRIRPARRLLDFGMYHACFPQLIAGPIVRYEDVKEEIEERVASIDDFYNGVLQFCIGLSKKAILADPLGRIADQAFSASSGQLDFTSAWLGIVAYTLQIYLDFSGYSDMAIGLGRTFGFHFPENFNQPYRSISVTEFWRRWHMTLSRWFRDYVYIPLGGNRHGSGRTLLNLLAVFFLCGLWHGAGYSFVVWGLYHGILLVAERLMGVWCPMRVPRLIGWLWTMLSVMAGWVIFRAADLPTAGVYLQSLSGRHLLGSLNLEVTPDRLTVLALAAAVALIPFRPFVTFTAHRYEFSPAWATFALGAALVAIISSSVNGFTPFIYFRF